MDRMELAFEELVEFDLKNIADEIDRLQRERDEWKWKYITLEQSIKRKIQEMKRLTMHDTR